jgi:hypothetical protein
VDVSHFSQEVILPFLHLFNLDLTCPLCRFQDVLLQNQETDKPQPIERYKTIHDVLVHLPKRTMELKQTTFLRQCTCEDPECGKSTLSASAQSLLLKRTAFKSFLRIVAANRHASAWSTRRYRLGQSKQPLLIGIKERDAQACRELNR